MFPFSEKVQTFIALHPKHNWPFLKGTQKNYSYPVNFDETDSMPQKWGNVDEMEEEDK